MEQETFENKVQMSGKVVTDVNTRPSPEEPDHIRFMVSTMSGGGSLWVQVRIPIALVGVSHFDFSKGNSIFLEGEIRESSTKDKGTKKFVRRNYIWVTRFSQNPLQGTDSNGRRKAAKEFEPVTNVLPGH